MVDTLDGFARRLRELRKQKILAQGEKLLDAFLVRKQLQAMAH